MRSSSDHVVTNCDYRTYKSIIAVDTYGIFMATQHMICFEILSQYFDNLFDYTFQEGDRVNLLNINIIQNKSDIIIDQTSHIIKNIIQ